MVEPIVQFPLYHELAHWVKDLSCYVMDYIKAARFHGKLTVYVREPSKNTNIGKKIFG